MDLLTALTIRAQRTAAPAWEMGTVTAAQSGNIVTVNCRGANEKAYVVADVNGLQPGYTVAVLRGGPVPLVISPLSVTGDGTQGPPLVSPTASSGITTFPALFSYTWEMDQPEGTAYTVQRWQGWTDVSQGTSWPGALPVRKGYWYHNWSIASTLAGATVDSARMWLPRSVNGPTSSTVTMVYRDVGTIWPPQAGSSGPYGDVPLEPFNAGTAVTYTSASIGVGGGTWTPLDTSIVQFMVNATVSPSVFIPPPLFGVCGTTNLTLAGVRSDPTSGQIEITWHR